MSETAQFEVPVSTMAQGNAGLGCSQCTFGKELGQRTELVVGESEDSVECEHMERPLL
jgi:hypothetical protein